MLCECVFVIFVVLLCCCVVFGALATVRPLPIRLDDFYWAWLKGVLQIEWRHGYSR